jgi:outer membrane lipoprotein-sorting protein
MESDEEDRDFIFAEKWVSPATAATKTFFAPFPPAARIPRLQRRLSRAQQRPLFLLMRILHAFFSLACACASILPAVAAPSASEVVTRAREKIGTEAKLTAVNTLVYESKHSRDGKEFFAMLEYKRPAKRREYSLEKSEGGAAERVIATNGLEGFSKLVNLATGNQQIRPFGAAQIKFYIDLFHAETGFYSTPPGGSVAYVGEAKQSGKDVYTLEYKHAGGLIIRRHFDKLTYKLVAYELYSDSTPAEQRLLVEEEGDKEVDGIHFAEKSTVYVGGKKSYTVQHTTIKVNSNIPDSTFAFPMP